MKVWRRARSGARLAVFIFLITLSLPAFAQNINTSGSSNCAQADFDTNLEFVNGPADYYTVVVNKRNISSHSCVFDGSVYGPSFFPDRIPGHEPVALCYFCDDQSNRKQSLPPPVTANPGQIVRQIFRWKTTLPDNETCLEPKWMSGPLLLVAPSLLKPICSKVDVSRFSLETSASSSEEESSRSHQPFSLTASKSRYYVGEPFALRLSILAGSQNPPSDAECPTVYIRERSPDGTTRIDEVQPYAFKACGTPVLGHDVGDWRTGFDLPSGVNSKWTGVGEHSLEVFRLASSPDDPRLDFTYSNELRIRQVDPAAISRKWGQKVKGIAADITLDKVTYRLGEDVPLHLAVPDFDAPVAVYSWDAVWDPCAVVKIEVVDARDKAVAGDKLFPLATICTGHGFGPRLVTKGRVIPLERTLRMDGLLPNQPGIYKVVVTWAPCYNPRPAASSSDQPEDLQPYTVVRAAATIRIVSEQAER